MPFSFMMTLLSVSVYVSRTAAERLLQGKSGIVMDLNQYTVHVERKYELSQAQRRAQKQQMVSDVLETRRRRHLWFAVVFRKLASWFTTRRGQPVSLSTQVVQRLSAKDKRKEAERASLGGL